MTAFLAALPTTRLADLPTSRLADYPSPTWFTSSPEWGWLIVVYFFLGGIAGGAAFLSGLLDLLGDRGDRRMTRIGYWIALVAIVLGGPLLIADLTRPERFWHMIWMSETGGPLFKYFSPMSLGVWLILGFVLFVALAALASLADMGRFPRGFAVFSEGVLGKIVALGCMIFGSALAGYTGLVLSGTNRPLWGDTAWITLLFLLSGIATGGAAMILFGWRWGHPGTVRWIEQMEGYSSLLELAVLAIVAVTIWSVVSVVWSGVWAAVLLVGVVLLGILLPIALRAHPRTLGAATVPIAALLVLVGGFLLRTVVILSSEAV
jgi:formate-dependent nitrite reductase membrane component NrfD